MTERRPRRRGATTRGIERAGTEIKRVQWLWHPYLPEGKLVMFDGNPGRAKSMLAINMAAHVVLGLPLPSRVHRVPDGRKPRGVVLVCTEDDWEDTILPRLLATFKALRPRISAEECEQALQRIRRVTPVVREDGRVVPFRIPQDLKRLRAAVRSIRAALVVVDPIMAFLGSEVDPYKDASVRAGLTPLQSLAQETNVAVILIRHFNKDTRATAESRGGGSLGGFLGLARGGWLVEFHPERGTTLVFTNYKNNLAAKGESIAYEVVPYSLTWRGVTVDTAYAEWGDWLPGMSADDVLRGRDSRRAAPSRDAAKAAITYLLDERDPYPGKEILALLKEDGHKDDTIKAAKVDLGVRSVPERNPRTGLPTRWLWTRKPPEES